MCDVTYIVFLPRQLKTCFCLILSAGDSAYEVGAAGTSLVELYDEDTLDWVQRNLTVDNGGRDYPHELSYDTGEACKLKISYFMKHYTM